MATAAAAAGRGASRPSRDTLLNPANIGTVAFRDVLAEDAHPPIIDREVLALADQILTERGENPAKAAGVASGYHLTGKINCPLCGKAYLGMTATVAQDRRSDHGLRLGRGELVGFPGCQVLVAGLCRAKTRRTVCELVIRWHRP